MKLTLLGTGNALVTKYYNTCFVLEENNEYILTDGGGGNGVLSQLEKVNINWADIKNIILTHAHTDHLLGIVWMVRMICQYMKQGTYNGEVVIFGAEEVLSKLKLICKQLISKKEFDFLGERVFLKPVSDGETIKILEKKFTFFDINSTKTKQFGFSIEYEKDKKLTCCGDEPYNDMKKKYVINSDYLMHEAFCLYRDKDIFRPYEKHHSTVKDACKLAENLNIKNLILYHTEDKTFGKREQLYLNEGKNYYRGNLIIPNDLEEFVL